MKSLLFILLIFLCGCNDSIHICGEDNISSINQHPIPLNKIVGNAKYHQELVLIEGYFTYEFERVAIFNDKQAAKDGLHQAIWLNFDHNLVLEKENLLKKLNGHHVVVQGVYSRDSYGHMGKYGGTLSVNCIKSN